ncbi:PAS domain-containing protein [Pseudomonas sp. WHRI 8519]|uniref:PAS domain-containing protein n=1 Tax=Pseudomonas sp. WHRI 8519 TaxID=3162567 RepID=UPI003557E57E
MAIAEFALDGTLNRANDNYLALLGYSQKDVPGRHHRSFCQPSFVESEEYPALWQHLRAGIAHSDKIERLRQDGTSCWLEATGRIVH